MVTVSFLFIENSDLLIGSKQIAGFVYVDSIIPTSLAVDQTLEGIKDRMKIAYAETPTGT
jgi:hypothetical protein